VRKEIHFTSHLWLLAGSTKSFSRSWGAFALPESIGLPGLARQAVKRLAAVLEADYDSASKKCCAASYRYYR
jgi:hypothetical protein